MAKYVKVGKVVQLVPEPQPEPIKTEKPVKEPKAKQAE